MACKVLARIQTLHALFVHVCHASDDWQHAAYFISLQCTSLTCQGCFAVRLLQLMALATVSSLCPSGKGLNVPASPSCCSYGISTAHVTSLGLIQSPPIASLPHSFDTDKLRPLTPQQQATLAVAFGVSIAGVMGSTALLLLMQLLTGSLKRAFAASLRPQSSILQGTHTRSMLVSAITAQRAVACGLSLVLAVARGLQYWYATSTLSSDNQELYNVAAAGMGWASFQVRCWHTYYDIQV